MLAFCCRLTLLTMALLAAPLLHSTHSLAETLPSEPGEENLLNEDVNIFTGFYIREYSLQQNGIVDYRTARQIIRSQYNEYFNTVVEAKPHPLFYWYDSDQSGVFTMWIDPQGDGCLCHVVPYTALARPAWTE